MGFNVKVKLRSEQAGVSGKPEPKDVVRAIRSQVATVMMDKHRTPGAFVLPVDITQGQTRITGSLEFKLIPSATDGHFLFNVAKGNLKIGKLECGVNANASLPKDPEFYLSEDTLRVYALCKKAQQKGESKLSQAERVELENILAGLADAMDAGESTGDAETEPQAA